MQTIYNSIEHDMLMVNDTILDHLKSEEPLIEVVSKYLVHSAGKRLRPMLTILSSKLFEYQSNAHINLAAAVEFIHAATLLHDDVVDNSTMRRFKDTANVVWGNKTSILVGDFLFAQSFKLMVGSGSMSSLQSLAQASAVIAEGEVMQLVRLGEKRILTEKEYNVIINAKTAELFGAACEVGAIISNQDTNVINALKQFGCIFGIIFQITDDLLDYFGDTTDLGKNIGDDFIEGKITLPVILAYEQSSSAEKQFWQNMILSETRDMESFRHAMTILEKHKIKQQISDSVNLLTNSGTALLQDITCNELYKSHLVSLMQYAASRSK